MAKASIGQATQRKEQAPPPVARKKPKVMAADPKRKAAAGKVLTKATAVKPAPSRGKAAAAKATPSKQTGMKGKAPASAKTGTKQAASRTAAAGKRSTAKRSAPGKAASGKAALAKKAPRLAASPAKAAAKPVMAKPIGTRPAAKPIGAKPVGTKKVADRRPASRTAVPTPAARRPRAAAAPRKSPAATVRKAESAPAPGAAPDQSGAIRTSVKPPQVFTVSHLSQADFKTDGLRTYARYRDLGIAGATGGLCQAHVIRFIPPCTDAVRKRHLHEADLQLVYVLQGWMKNEFEGHGEQMMSAGSCWLQPSGIKHTVLEYSADCEVLEIIVPADFKTEELA
jgi:uncharacterized RmlC-like cupin family protein